MIKSPVPVEPDKIIDATRFLAKDGKIYVLPNLVVPESDPSFAVTAKSSLEKLVSGKKCTLYQTRSRAPGKETGRINRMGETIAHMTCPDAGSERWVPARLVEDGLVMVWPDPAAPELSDELLPAEEGARAAKKGIWADRQITVKTPETVTLFLDSRQIVQGRVESVTLKKDNLYINFGKDWKSDFTIGVPADLQRTLTRQGLSLQSLAGKTVRVRGWVRYYNGPFIGLETASQLEILPPPAH